MAIKPVIIITGASWGLGAAIACWLAKTGAGMALIARSGEKLGQSIPESLLFRFRNLVCLLNDTLDPLAVIL
jgi:short-subunit dehydrogenase